MGVGGAEGGSGGFGANAKEGERERYRSQPSSVQIRSCSYFADLGSCLADHAVGWINSWIGNE